MTPSSSAPRRTFQPVRAASRFVGTIEPQIWRPTSQEARREALEAARLYELKHKRKGRRNGALGHVGLEVLEALWSVVDYATGRLEPSLRWIMENTGRCRDAVVTALKRLRRCGFLRWVNRCVPTGRRGERGPQVEQATNAYALAVPEDAAALVPARRPRTEARSATPADYRLAIERAAVALDAASRPYRADHYRDALSLPLPKALKTLGLLLNECESVMPEQSRLKNLPKRGSRPKPR